MDSNILNSYQPVSNWPILSNLCKIVERVVAVRLNKYLLDSTESRQSAYGTGQSSETILILVNIDITMSIDKSEAVILVLLKLSAAFDRADHNILFCRLE